MTKGTEPNRSAAGALRRLGKYDLIARIAAGGMAEVFLARQLGLMNFQKVVVVKVIHAHLAEQQEFVDMFLDEARVSALIKHHRVVDIYDLGKEGATYFIAMEYIAGQALTRLIVNGKKRQPLDVFTVCQVIADAADGLHAAHTIRTMDGRQLELVHRDVSPGNIMVTYSGEVKILDFGVSKSIGRITQTEASQIKGKLGYASPELIEEKPLDRRADVFSLGVVLWESLVLSRLFKASSPAATVNKVLNSVVKPPSVLRQEVPTELDRICLRALNRDPKMRYQTAAAMRDALHDFLRQANYRREAGRLRMYMDDFFSEQRAEQEKLLSDVVAADHELEIEIIDSRELDDAIDAREDDSGVAAKADFLSERTREVDVAERVDVLLPKRTPTPPPVPAPLASPVPSVDSVSAADTVDALPRMDESAIEEADSNDAPAVAMPAANKFDRRYVAAAAVAAVVLLGSLIMRGGGDDTEPSASASGAVDDTHATAPATPTTPTAPPETPTTPPATPTTPPATPTTPPAPPTTDPTPDPPVADPVSDPDPAVKPADPPAAPPELSKAEARKLARKKYREGTRLYVGGNASAAKARFREALKLRPGYSSAYKGLGLVYARQGNNSKAIKYFKRYLRGSPRARDADSIRSRIKRLGG